MITLNLIQGSEEWKATRLNNFGASEAPAMMNESKYMGRNELLKMKFTGESKPVSSHQQKIFDKGHATEEMARPIVEKLIGDELYPVTGVLESSKILASFDGLTMLEDIAFEHKLYNKTLAENVKNNILEPHYYWQLEQQLLVSGAEKVIFVTSDGTEENFESMWYESMPERRKALILGWEQFEKDLADYQPEAEKEVIIANEQESFPVIKCSVEGSLVVSNLGEYIPVIKQLADEQMRLVLETDQDFADKEAFNKNVKAGRATLKTQATDIEKQFESLAEFNGFVSQADTILQKLQSHGEKQVKQAKEAKKSSIVNSAYKAFNEHLAKLSETINKVQITQVVVDFEAVMKGKRSFEKMEEAVNSSLANAKIEANEISQVIRKNLDSLSELAKDHRFLFSDHAMLLLKDNDDLINLIKARINEHEKAEAERKRLEKEEIERQAKVKAEREAKAKIEAEEKRIRDEERLKIETEQKEKTEQEKVIEDAVITGTGIVQDGKRISPKDFYLDPAIEQKTVEQRLAETFADAQEEQPTKQTKAPGGYTTKKELTPHEEMLREVNFWCEEYHVINSQHQDLFRILNKYK